MGKQGKRSKQRCNDLRTTETVSILTPTVRKRDKCLYILADCISKQTYISKITQWVIVSADKNWNYTEFTKFTNELQKRIPTNVNIDGLYITPETAVELGDKYITDDYEAIGYLRNVTNMRATGDYIVCMDDDDYYPPERVEHSVVSLKRSNKMVAGCSNHIMYDADLETVFQFRKFGPNHSINNAFSYKRRYIEEGARYTSSKRHAEERDFLCNYKTEMIQLDPLKTVVQMCHTNNTFNKRPLIVNASWMPSDKCSVFKISSRQSAYVPTNVLKKYREALNYDNDMVSEYDIVYYTGCGCPQWSPYDTKLGGSEQAVKHLVESWTKKGFSVAVYGDFTGDVTERTMVDDTTGIYLNYANFKCSQKYNVLILWRLYGISPTITWPLKANRIYWDIHDNIKLPDSCIENVDKVTNIMVRSDFHARDFCEKQKSSEVSKRIMIVPNGVRVRDFTPLEKTERDPYRFCWCSCYKRGLLQILAWVWPIIKQNEPRASFHVYYGMDGVKEEDFKSLMRNYLAQPGVIDHGRQSVNDVIKEKHTSTFHLYFSKTKAETDCISLRESACAGCIPLISKHFVFAEREGIHFDGDPLNQNDMNLVGANIVELMKQPDQIKKVRDSLIGNEIDWDKISSMWSIEDKA